MIARRKLCVAAFMGACVAAAQAGTPGVDEPPLAGPALAVAVPPVHEARLSNGLQLLIVPRPGLPLVTASLLVRAGRESDPPAHAGLASLTANLLSKGARRQGRAVTAPELARQAEALGSVLSVATSWRASSLSMSVTTPQLPQALALISDVVRAPTMLASEFERARAQAVDGLRVILSNPADVAALAARRAHWGDSAYGAAPTPASLQRLRPAQLRQFHAQWWRPAHAVLVLAGDISPEAGRQLAHRHFGHWLNPRNAAPALHAPPGAPLAAQQVLIDMPGSGQSGVVIAAPFAALDSPDRRVAEVAAALLGGGYSARLNQEVRIRRGLSYGAFGGGESFPSGGLFTAQAQTNHPTAGQVAQLMREQMLRIGREVASADELAARQATLVGSFARQLQTTEGLAQQVASQWFQGLPMTELARYVEQVLAVTPEQVRDFAARHWSEASLRTVLSVDVQAAGATLQPVLDGALRVPLPELDLEQATLRRR